MKAGRIATLLLSGALLLSGVGCAGGSGASPTPALTPVPTPAPIPGLTPTPANTYKVKFGAYGHGQSIDIYHQGELVGRFWAGAVYLDAELFFENTQAWAVDLDNTMPRHEGFEAYLGAAPDESPWREIGYIHTTYSPTLYSHRGNAEAAAIQLAIWKWLYGREAVTSGETGIETRALEIYDSAAGQTSVLPLYIDPVLDGIQHTIVSAHEIPTPTTSPTPTPCETDRDTIQAALYAYYAEKGEWPTANGQPGKIDWDKLMPGFLDAIPSTDSKCHWQVNSNPEGRVCLLRTC